MPPRSTPRKKQKSLYSLRIQAFFWSEWGDLNPRPLGPEWVGRRSSKGLKMRKILHFQCFAGLRLLPENGGNGSFPPENRGLFEGMRGK